MDMAHRLSPLPAPGLGCRIAAGLVALLLLSACQPASKSDEEVRKEIQGLKAQVTAMQEKLNQVQAGQQAMLDLLKKPAPALSAEPMVMPSRPQPQAPESLTVGQLLASKDRYLGTRVTVKGMPGPVMVHHKSLMLKSPQGMVEVMFGNIPDPKLVQTLTSTPLDKPLTVTGIVNLPPARGAGAQLQINAEAVEF
jgi:outer membrane murein-binding lipoprotein Lpp